MVQRLQARQRLLYMSLQKHKRMGVNSELSMISVAWEKIEESSLTIRITKVWDFIGCTWSGELSAQLLSFLCVTFTRGGLSYGNCSFARPPDPERETQP